MSINWGYQCKTCKEDSACWLDDPRVLREIYLGSKAKLERIWANQRITLNKAELLPILFLAKHHGHDLWVGNDYAGLRLPRHGSEADS